MVDWTNDELSNYNKAERAHYDVGMNGKTDISPVIGTADYRIGLSVKGMFRLTKDWLSSGHQLSTEERAELIDLIATRGKKVYNPKTKEWEDKD
ncbi:hypothetical protein [Tuberibacillus sp. Marseille-P3662]|uniref:hypothetical protein n=1 Tax=Tuberibacillus sp. Marseille-P3662 TaxID=1965358 RepID=UPI000A1CE784|nr:hypothetical protein [Tuberibacillus sp. Marseille-P3662]